MRQGLENNANLAAGPSFPAAKIALFRGCEDVYPRRFESHKTGYSPVCANEWARGVCEKPKVKCGDCFNRRFLPVTDETVCWHLSGHDDGRNFVMGVYPMLQQTTECLWVCQFNLGTLECSPK